MQRIYTFITAILFSTVAFGQYCNYQGDCDGDWITNIKINGYENSNTGCDNYTDYTGVVDMYLTPGAIFDVSASWATYSDGAVYLFFDWNDDKTWDSGTERYVLAQGGTSASLTLTVPNDVVAGTSIKVRAMLGNSADPADACTGGPVGILPVSEVEDYTVQVLAELPTPSGDPTYCSAQGNDCDFGHMVNVNLVNIDNPSACTFYGDYTETVSFDLPLGSNEVLTVTWGGQGTAYNYVLAAWIDFNKDGTFANDEMFPLSASGAGVSTGVLAVDANASEGKTRMRIRMVQNGAPNACGSQSRGEVEDYTVIIGTPPPSCAEAPMPNDQFQGICQKDLTLSWTPSASGAAPTGYKLSFGTNNPPDDLILDFDNGLDTFYNYTAQLQANTQYFWSVTPYSDKGDASSCEVWTFFTSAQGDPNVEAINKRNSVDEVFACEGSSEILYASVFGGNAPYTYNWSGTDINKLSPIDKDSAVYTTGAVSTDMYYIDVEDANGCKGVDSITVTTVVAANAGEIQGDKSLCAGESLTLSSPQTEGSLRWQLKSPGASWSNLTGQSGNNYFDLNPVDGNEYRLIAETSYCADTTDAVAIEVYSLSPAPSILSSTGAFEFCDGASIILISSVEDNNEWSTGTTNDSLEVQSTVDLSVFYFDANGCESETASVSVTKNDNPSKPEIVEAMGASSMDLCEGTELSLTTDSEESIAWNGDANISGSSITIDTPGKYWVDVVDANSCASVSDTLELIERANPTKPNIISDEGDSFCSGSSINLSSDASDPIYWMNDKAINSANYELGVAGDVVVTAFNEYGCETTSDIFTVSENPSPIQPLIRSVSGADAYCSGDSLELSATSNDSFFWMEDEDNTADNYYASTAGKYYVTAFNAFGCVSTSDTMDVTENELPEKPIIQMDGATLYCANLSGQFQWYRQFEEGDEVEIDGETNDTLYNASNGEYFLVYTDPETGCSSRSDIVVVSGIKEYSLNKKSFYLYPNPIVAGHLLHVNVIAEELIITNMQGEVIRIGKGKSIKTDGIAAGVYFVLGKVDGSTYALGKVVLE